MNIFYGHFSTGQVATATGVPNATLQSWIKRGVIVAQTADDDAGRGITGGGAPGLHRRFSFFNVMEIAIAKALLDAGMSDLESAFAAARHYAHTGRGEISPDHPARDPGCPFDNRAIQGSTLIAARGPKSVELLWKIGDDLIPIIWHYLGSREGFVVIDAGYVFDRTVTALGYKPAEVMSLAYGPVRTNSDTRSTK